MKIAKVDAMIVLSSVQKQSMGLHGILVHGLQKASVDKSQFGIFPAVLSFVQ
jgi:hypothetical protein